MSRAVHFALPQLPCCFGDLVCNTRIKDGADIFALL